MDRLTEYRWDNDGMHLDGSDYPEPMSPYYLWFRDDEIKVLVKELSEARELLRQAGNALEIQGNQKARALRFQILNFLKGGGHEA